MHTVTRGGGRDTGLEEVFRKFSCQTTDLSKQESLKEIALVLRKVIPSTYSLRCDIRLRRHYFLWGTFFNQCFENIFLSIFCCALVLVWKLLFGLLHLDDFAAGQASNVQLGSLIKYR